jgi:hypothetical protein
MSTGKRRDPQLERRWRERIALWQRAGVTVSDFCAEQGVSVASFQAWKRELAIRDRASAPITATMPTFVPVRVAPATMIEVVLANEIIVRVPMGADALTVSRLVAALGATPC